MVEVITGCRDAHALTAATGTGFDDNRESNLVDLRNQCGVVLLRSVITRYDGNANGFHFFSCRRFIGHHLNLSRRWADKDGPCFNARCGEKRIL